MKKKIMIAVAALALVGLLAGVAVAQAASPADKGGAPAFFQTFLEKFAANLGVDKDKVSEALKQTQEQMIDEAVQEGKMTSDEAAKLKERIQNNACPFLGPMGPFGGHRGGGFGGPNGTLLAQVLGMSEDELKAQLKDGKKIQDLVQEKGLTMEQVWEKMKKLRIQQIQQAVTEGKLDQEKASAMIERIQNAPQGPLGKGRGEGLGLGKGPGRGHGGPFGSPFGTKGSNSAQNSAQNSPQSSSLAE